MRTWMCESRSVARTFSIKAKWGSMSLSGVPGSFEDTFRVSSLIADSVLWPCAHPEERTTDDPRATRAIFQMKRECCGIFTGQILWQCKSNFAAVLRKFEASFRAARGRHARLPHFAEQARVANAQGASG